MIEYEYEDEFDAAAWELAEEAQDAMGHHGPNWHEEARKASVAMRRKLKEVDKILELYAIASFRAAK